MADYKFIDDSFLKLTDANPRYSSTVYAEMNSFGLMYNQGDWLAKRTFALIHEIGGHLESFASILKTAQYPKRSDFATDNDFLNAYTVSISNLKEEYRKLVFNGGEFDHNNRCRGENYKKIGLPI